MEGLFITVRPAENHAQIMKQRLQHSPVLLSLYSNFSLHQASNIVIITDSLSTLQALSNYSSSTNKDICHLAQCLHKLISRYGTQITLQWIPGHEDIAGNDRADTLAKEGSQKEQVSKPCNFTTAKQIIKVNTKMYGKKDGMKGKQAE